MDEVQIRRATVDDLEPIYRINLTWGEMSMAWLLERKYGRIGEQSASVLKAEQLDQTCRQQLNDLLVAEVGGRIVGYALVLLDERRRIGTVGENAVDPAYRGCGIGTALQRRVQRVFRERGMKYAHVTTMVHDRAARRVYEGMGFEEYARSIHYFMELDGTEQDADADRQACLGARRTESGQHERQRQDESATDRASGRTGAP